MAASDSSPNPELSELAEIPGEVLADLVGEKPLGPEAEEDASRTMISFSHVSMCFGDRRVLNDVSFSVNRGETLCILGRSGVGKSVALRILMQVNLGFDENSIWQIQGIQKTPVEGISKVTVLIGDKTGKQQPYRFAFFTTPDGKHIIVGDKIVAFGEHPFAEYRSILQQRANGPYRGAAAKDLELVEFADFQCPHCKAAQANMHPGGGLRF